MLKIQNILLFIALLPHDRSVHLFKTTDDLLDVLVFIELAMFGRKIWQINRCVCVCLTMRCVNAFVYKAKRSKIQQEKIKVKFTKISGVIIGHCENDTFQKNLIFEEKENKRMKEKDWSFWLS